MGAGARSGRTIAAAAVALALTGAAVTLGLAYGRPGPAVVYFLAGASPAAFGLRIERALPGHGMALRLALTGTAVGLAALGAALLDADLGTAAPATRWGAIIDESSWMVVLGTLASILLGFPDGRPPTPRWARAERVVAATVALTLAGVCFGRPELVLEDGRSVPSPLPAQDGALTSAVWLGLAVLFAWLIASFVAVRRRYRRAQGVERLQLTWLAYGAASVPLVMVVCLANGAAGGPGWVLTVAFFLPLVVLPATIAMAVLRHRLYEIDRLINRTLVYGALTAVLAAVYAMVVLALGTALGGGSTLAVAAATLAVSVGFAPARAHLQQGVDRRFAKRRYAGLQRVATYLEDVRSGVEEPERLGIVLAGALGDPGLEVFFRLPASGGYADTSGRIVTLPGDGLRARTPVTRSGQELGVVVHDPALARTPDTLDSVLRATGLAFEIARLRVELRVQLAEVEASRARLLGAAEAERRKLERDLHDGAQQRLVALGLALRHAQHQVDGDRDGALRTLDAAVGELTSAVAELRAIARGLRPSLLDRGIGPALVEVAARAPVPVAVEVAPGAALPPGVETTTFFLACEALTNAFKHAGASKVRVRVDHRPGGVRLEVADDGDGGAHLQPGGGLAGMHERAAALGGTLSVESAPDHGTRIVADLPCAS